MGLERLSILFELEQRLDIKLPSEAIMVRTVGDLESLVRAATPREKSCLGAAAFYRVRRGFIAAGVPRAHVRPSTSLTALLPRGTRLRRAWRKISAHERALPPLVPPGRLDAILCLACAIGCFALVIGLPMIGPTLGIPFLVSVGCALIITFVAIQSLSSLSAAIGWRIPKGIETVRDLVRSVAPLSLLDLVRLVVAEECAVELDEITPETNLRRDLDI